MLTPITRLHHDLTISTSILAQSSNLCAKQTESVHGVEVAPASAQGNDSEVTISIERIAVLSYKRRLVRKYGVVVTHGTTKHEICFNGNDQTVLYVLALMRHKMGLPLYIHEFSINGKGGESDFSRDASSEWFSKVFNIVYNGERKSFDTWFNCVRRKGRVLYQAKSQTASALRAALGNEEVAAMCELITTNDALGDTFYTFKCPGHNIKLPAELERLMC